MGREPGMNLNSRTHERVEMRWGRGVGAAISDRINRIFRMGRVAGRRAGCGESPGLAPGMVRLAVQPKSTPGQARWMGKPDSRQDAKMLGDAPEKPG